MAEQFNVIENAAKGFRDSLVEERLADLQIEEGRLPGQMIQTRDDEVRNHAGGYVFKVSDEIRVRRFLILGSAGGTYYSTEKELTMENMNDMKEIIDKGFGDIILREIREISLAGRNPKQQPLIFALALCARYGVRDVTKLKHDGKRPDLVAYYAYIQALQRAAMELVVEVCRIPTHLFMFVKYCELVAAETGETKESDKKSDKKGTTGWGRLMRNTICHWYDAKKPEELAMHLTKYKNREGWTHRDLFRLAHPRPSCNEHTDEHLLEVEQLYRFAVKGTLDTRKRKLPEDQWKEQAPFKKYTALALENELTSAALNLVEAANGLNAQSKEEDVVKAINEHRLVREHIPTQFLNSVPVWHALLNKMPLTAMIRNLGKLSSINALDEVYTKKVVEKLTSEKELQASKIHPITVLLAKTVYQQGRGDKGKLTWKVDEQIDAALEDAFYKSFKNVPPTGKRFCFAYDVSGSMCSQISGTMLSCRTASAALSLVSLRNETAYECVGFCDSLTELPYDGSWDIKQIEEHMDGMSFGSTDCALPMIWAMEKKKEFDVFVVFTDCETWFGETKPYDALRKYREASGILDAKLIVMGMTSHGFTIADPSDVGMLDVVGFDSAVPSLIHEFVAGKL